MPFAGELNQSTLVEPGTVFSGKVDVAFKLHVAVKVEMVVLTGEGGLLEVLGVELLEVDEVEEGAPIKEEKDLQVVWGGDVVVDAETSSVDKKSRHAVEEMPVGEIHASTSLPLMSTRTTRPDGDDLQETIDFS